MTPEESNRLHLDWWGQCRTCKHWQAPEERPNLGSWACGNEKSPLHQNLTQSGGQCEEWESFDGEDLG